MAGRRPPPVPAGTGKRTLITHRARATAAAVPQPATAVHPYVAMPHSSQVESMLAGQAGHVMASRAVASAAPPPGASAVQGVDVASFQHSSSVGITWPAVASAGYKFAFVKAVEGNYYVNPYAAGDL